MEPIREMVPLSERGTRLLWKYNRLHHLRCSPKVLSSGCMKLVYRCKVQGCPGTVLLTEYEPDTDDFYEEGKHSSFTFKRREVDGV